MNIKNTLIAVLSGLLFISSAWAQSDAFEEGTHYDVMETIQPISTGDQIEVLELFYYHCPHCNQLEAPLHEWLKNGKPDNADYVAFPAIFAPKWEAAARTFYTLQALGLEEELHPKVFYAYHSERRNKITSPDQLAEWVAENGGNAQDVLDTYESFTVNSKIDFANKMTREYGITGVPAIIVDGKYRTSVSKAGGHDALFELINFLVAKAAAERDS